MPAAGRSASRAPLHFDTALLMLCCTGAITAFADGGITKWLTIYLAEDLGCSEGKAGLTLTFVRVASIIGRLGADWTPVVRQSLPRMSFVGGVLSAGAFAGALAVNKPAALFAGSAAVSLIAANFSPVSSRSVKALWPERKASAQALLQGFTLSGRAAAAPLTGFVAEAAGLRLGLGIVVIEGLIKAGLAPLLYLAIRSHHERQQQERRLALAA